MCVLCVLQWYWRVSHNRRCVAVLVTVRLQQHWLCYITDSATATLTVLHYRQCTNGRWIQKNYNFYWQAIKILWKLCCATATSKWHAHTHTHAHTYCKLPAVFHICKKTKFRKLFPLLSSHEYIILTLLSPLDGTVPETQIDSIQRRNVERSTFLHQDGITSRFWYDTILYLNWQDGGCVCFRIVTVFGCISQKRYIKLSVYFGAWFQYIIKSVSNKDKGRYSFNLKLM